MGASTFLIFDTHYPYASLATPLLGVLLVSDLARDGRLPPLHLAVVTLPLMIALAVTHHMTALFAAVKLGGVALLDIVRMGLTRPSIGSVVVAVMAVVVPLLWSRAMGNPSAGYLGPVFANAVTGPIDVVRNAGGRRLFTADDGAVAPAWQRHSTLRSASSASRWRPVSWRTLTAAGVPARGLMTLRPAGWRSWRNSHLLLLALLTLGYPLSILFRLARGGWEIGNRIGPFTFFGIGLVAAFAVVGLWQGRSRNYLRAGLVAAACSVVIVGGVISAEAPAFWCQASSRYPPMPRRWSRWAYPLRSGAGRRSSPGSSGSTWINRLLLAIEAGSGSRRRCRTGSTPVWPSSRKRWAARRCVCCGGSASTTSWSICG